MSSTIIHVGDTASKFQAFADFFDGVAPVAQRAEISILENSTAPVLVVTPPELDPQIWPLCDIRALPDQAGRDILVLSHTANPVARLIIREPEARRILSARCPNLSKGAAVKGAGRLVTWSLAAVASVALIVFVLVPLMADQLAEFLPPAGEKALGDATFEQIRSALSSNDLVPVEVCDNSDGLAALAIMQARLEENIELPYPLSIHVLDHKMINAFALPGGQIVIFRGLIDAAETPDEVAAVFAHEIGHVINRDPARGALRSAGSIGVLGLLLGDFAGGTAVLLMVERLIDATYSQEAEAKADSFAHETLAATGIQPSALATMFERLKKKHGDAEGFVAHFLAHPSLGDRIAAALNANNASNTDIRPSLNDTEWKAMQAICR
jgi:predicted Zn-dependent protease